MRAGGVHACVLACVCIFVNDSTVNAAAVMCLS